MNDLIRACVLVASVLVLAGCGSEDDEATPPATTVDTQTQTDTQTTTETETETEPAPPQPVTITITVRDGAPVGGIARPSVDQGDRVVLVVRSDVAGEVHLHGYDLERRVAPGSPARIRFRATIPGRFEIELHAHPELPIGELTVRP